MVGMKRFCAFALASVFAGALLVGCADKTQTSSQNKEITIGVMQPVDHIALNNARDGFVDRMKELDPNVKFSMQNAQGDPSNLQTIAQRFVNDKVNMILAIGTGSAQIAASETQQIPIMGTAITDYVEAKLVDSNQAPGKNVSGTSDMSPIADQMKLIQQLFPEAKTVGLMYSMSEPNSMVQAKIVKEELAKVGLEVREATVNSMSDVQTAAQSLVGKVDVIYVPTDNTMASSIAALIGVTEPNGIPVISGEGGPVELGCTATIGLDYYELGKQTADMAYQVLFKSADISKMPIEVSKNYNLIYNPASFEKLKLVMPEELKEKAQAVTSK